MVFNSYTFIVFFIVVVILHHLPFSWKLKKINLLLASYVFYAAWNPIFILLLWLSTLVDFFVGRLLYNENNLIRKKLLLIISLVGNLGMLCFFKYGGFLLDNFVFFVNQIGFDYHPAEPNIILPAGISFYTFTTLCYTIDMYRKESKPVKSLLDFSLFVTFFPHLVAGPIVRPPQLVPQFENPHTASRKQMIQGLFLLSLGLFMKVVLADSMLAESAKTVFGASQVLATLDAWMGVFAFSGQIFFDFAGYSTCAIGVASCLGFSLPENFLYPYAAIGFSDFWRRWHITLSKWLRDYLYIPLGGNRNGTFKTYVNLMITMLLGGLWHGANWTFVVWGALHGFYLWIEKMIVDFRYKKINITEHSESIIASNNGIAIPKFISKFFTNKIFLALLTYFLVNVTWVFFRATDFSSAWRLLASMFLLVPQGAVLLSHLSILKITIITLGTLIVHWIMRSRNLLVEFEKMHWLTVGIIWSIMLLLLIICQESSSSFIYFQF
ncbi:MAG: MBOAT family O-acyltransferase [Saprospiraceae bacterium]|nr:MBOAT family protein [Saprospiraceae bacterium]